MSKRTKGPWVATHSENKDRGFSHVVVNVERMSPEWPHPNCESFGVYTQNTIGDANLIAAAPDMFEALKNLENDDGKSMPETAWKLVKDAIAKAEGKV